MSRHLRRTLAGLTVATTLSAMLMAPAAASAENASGYQRSGRALTVMTRNVYVGGDITKPVRAASGKSGEAALVALGQANRELRRTVDRTSFSVRSRLLAREIARAAPDVVGLQEVALWRHGPMELNRAGVANAEEVDYDFLSMLLDELHDRRARYRVASLQQQSDVEAPAFAGNPFDGTATETRDVRLTVFDVILVRERAGIRVGRSGGGQYAARIDLDLDLSGVPFSIVRGYTWVDLRVRSQRLRFVNTHLESQSADLALAQARELGESRALRARNVVLVCDCNSDPLNDTVRPGSTVPYSAAYRLLTGSAGFTDQWRNLRHAQPEAPTAALSELVNDATSAALDRRLDLVLTRFALAEPRSRRGQTTGDELRDRDPVTGLWPSDHAGVVLDLRLRPSRGSWRSG